jgi:hypothetical protein
MKASNDELKIRLNLLAGDSRLSSEHAIALATWAMDKALEGMVPEDSTAKIDWPDGADGADIFFYSGMTPVGPSQPVYRPKPAWAPSVGDHVFWRNTLTIYTVVGVGWNMVDLINATDIPVSQLKPATMDQMGLDWAVVKMP